MSGRIAENYVFLALSIVFAGLGCATPQAPGPPAKQDSDMEVHVSAPDTILPYLVEALARESRKRPESRMLGMILNVRVDTGMTYSVEVGNKEKDGSIPITQRLTELRAQCTLTARLGRHELPIKRFAVLADAEVTTKSTQKASEPADVAPASENRETKEETQSDDELERRAGDVLAKSIMDEMVRVTGVDTLTPTEARVLGTVLPLSYARELYVHPDIPPRKLENARASVGIPSNEQVLALIDNTTMGSAKKCLLFGTNGIYFNIGMKGVYVGRQISTHIPYTEFPNRTFKKRSAVDMVDAGEGQYIVTSMAPGVVRILNAIATLYMNLDDSVRMQSTGRIERQHPNTPESVVAGRPDSSTPRGLPGIQSNDDLENDADSAAEPFSSPVHSAAQLGDLTRMKGLLSTEPGLANARFGEGWTPLHLAAANGHAHVVELLIAHSADVNAKGVENRTPLHFAAAAGQKKVAQLLAAAGADVEAKEDLGFTPLHTAIRTRNFEVAKLMIAKGADVDARTYHGVTPLDLAIHGGQQEMTELLITAGAKSTSMRDEPTRHTTKQNEAQLDTLVDAIVSKGDKALERDDYWAAVWAYFFAKWAVLDVEEQDRMGVGNAEKLEKAEKRIETARGTQIISAGANEFIPRAEEIMTECIRDKRMLEQWLPNFDVHARITEMQLLLDSKLVGDLRYCSVNREPGGDLEVQMDPLGLFRHVSGSAERTGFFLHSPTRTLDEIGKTHGKPCTEWHNKDGSVVLTFGRIRILANKDGDVLAVLFLPKWPAESAPSIND